MFDMESKIESLNNRHYKILDLCLSGYTNKEIAEAVGMRQTQVSIVTRSPNFQHELALRRERINEQRDTNLASVQDDATNILKDQARSAAMKLTGLLDSENEGIVRQSANDILDRTGHSKVIRQENKNLSAICVLKPEDLERLDATLNMIND